MTALAILLLIASIASPAQAAPRLDPFAAVDIIGKAGDSLPLDAAFIDEHGEKVVLGSLIGPKPVLLAPVYYECPNVCSVTLAGAMAALSSVPLEPGADYTFIAYSIDPREGPAEAHKAKAEALERFRATAETSAFHFLTGSEGEVRRLSEAIGFRYAWDGRIGQYAHAAAVAAVTADGRIARWLFGLSYQPTDLRLALVEAGQGRTGGLADKLLLLCYRYDPETGKYGSLVRGLLMGGGTLTVAILGTFIGGAVWRERRLRRSREPDS